MKQYFTVKLIDTDEEMYKHSDIEKVIIDDKYECSYDEKGRLKIIVLAYNKEYIKTILID